MKIVLILMLLAVVPLAAQTGAVKVTDELTLDAGVARHAGLDDVYKRFSKAYRDLDPSAVGAIYSKSAAYLVPGDNIIIGSDPILKSFTDFFTTVQGRNEKIAISFRIVQRKVEGSMAYDVGIYTLRTFKENVEKGSGQGKFVVVALREGDVWRFQVDGYSDLPKSKAAQ
jgi:ketosteroid isomerase-like protein